MLSLPSRVRVFAATKPVDFRRGFDGLNAIVRDEFRDDALSGDLFLFFNRARDRVKILVWDRNGFWLHYKRLERGTFERVIAADPAAARAEISRMELELLLEGIALKSVKSREHFVREVRLMPRHGEGIQRIESRTG
jgi:transposase